MIKNLNKMSEIEKLAKIWQIQLNIEFCKPRKNVRVSFKDIGPFCEYLALDFVPDYQGGGSGGMGFDLYNKKERKAIEVKSCCTIQNGKCKKCGAKFNNLFLDCCPDCGGNEFEKINDSRFGINAAETLRQYNNDIFAGFIFCHVSEKEQIKNKNTLVVLIEWFKLDFNADDEIKKIRLEYFENQKNFGRANTNNLLPYSFDFYKLAPLKIEEAIIEINYADLNTIPKVTRKNVNYYPRVNGNSLRFVNNERALFESLKTYDSKTNTAESKDFTLNIPYRIKSLGKERGDTRTKLDNALKNKVEQ